MTLTKCVAELNRLIETGRTVEAMEQFYADAVVMRENNDAPRVSKAICIAHEQKNLAKVRSTTAELLNQAIDAKRLVVFSEWRFTFTDLQNRRFGLEEVSVQQWQSGQVVRERFYYGTMISVD